MADALTFTEKKFKPEFIVDLATLTGAIIVSLDPNMVYFQIMIDYQTINQCWESVMKNFKMPLNDNFDKLINLKMQTCKI